MRSLVFDDSIRKVSGLSLPILTWRQSHFSTSEGASKLAARLYYEDVMTQSKFRIEVLFNLVNVFLLWTFVDDFTKSRISILYVVIAKHSILLAYDKEPRIPQATCLSVR